MIARLSAAVVGHCIKFRKFHVFHVVFLSFWKSTVDALKNAAVLFIKMSISRSSRDFGALKADADFLLYFDKLVLNQNRIEKCF
jgi:hypothetical protein